MGFVLNYARNYASLLVGRQPRRPLIVSYFITHRCPLACVYCSDGENKPFHADRAPEIETAEVKKLFRIFARATSVLDVTGGEPMVRPDLEELLAFAKSIGLTTILNTKGIGIAHRPELVDHADLLVLSLETFDPEKLAGIIGRPRATAEQVIRAVGDGLELTRKKKKRLVVSMVAMPGNLDDIEPVLRFCVENRVIFQIAPQMEGMTPPAALHGNPRYVEAMNAVVEAKKRTDVVVGSLGYLENIRDLRTVPCLPLLLADVRPDGGLYYPCLELKYTKENVLAHGSIERAQEASARGFGPIPDCGERCHVFCHMALSMMQQSLRSALAELKTL